MMLSSLKSHYHERLSDPDPRSLLTDVEDLLNRADPLLKPDTRSLRVPKWSFVPLVWPNRLGYLEEDTAACTGGQSLGTHNAKSGQVQVTSRRASSASVAEQYTGPGKSPMHRAASADEGHNGILNEIADMLNCKNKAGISSNSHGRFSAVFALKENTTLFS